MKNLVLFVDDGLTGKNLATIDLDMIIDTHSLSSFISEIFEVNHLRDKHNIIIKYGYRP